MLKAFLQLLGEDAFVFRRYLKFAVGYSLLCSLTLVLLVPVLTHLLTGDINAAIPWLLVLLVGMLFCWYLRHQVEQAGVRVGITVLKTVRHRLGDHVAQLPVGWFTSQNTSQLTHVVTQGIMAVAQLPAHVFTPVIAGIVTPIAIMLALFAMRWQMGLVALISLLVLSGALFLTGRIAKYADEEFQRRFADASQRMVEFAQAQPVLRAFNGEGGSARFLEQAVEQQRYSGVRLILLSTLSAVLNAWVVQAIFAVMLGVTVIWINSASDNGLDFAHSISLVVLLLVVSRFIDPLLEVSGYSDVLRNANTQLEAIDGLFSVRPLTEASAPQIPSNTSIDFCNVDFRYAHKESNALDNVNLHIAPGSMTALIGESGSGKTTLVRLIARFFDVTQGVVSIGGVDVRKMSSVELAGQISQIFQDSYLFAGSIADNIRIGKSDASDAEVMGAAEEAGVAEIIARLPDGLNTHVGEGGVRLSGGERQRIAIARALIKNSSILLVDEATAALDVENQTIITETLARLRGRRTLVVIAHQLSTVAMADQIVVLEKGQIVEQGSAKQLLEREGRYAQFLNQRKVSQGWRIIPASLTGIHS